MKPEETQKKQIVGLRICLSPLTRAAFCRERCVWEVELGLWKENCVHWEAAGKAVPSPPEVPQLQPSALNNLQGLRAALQNCLCPPGDEKEAAPQRCCDRHGTGSSSRCSIPHFTPSDSPRDTAEGSVRRPLAPSWLLSCATLRQPRFSHTHPFVPGLLPPLGPPGTSEVSPPNDTLHGRRCPSPHTTTAEKAGNAPLRTRGGASETRM